MEGNGGFPEYFKVNTEKCSFSTLLFYRVKINWYNWFGSDKISSQNKSISDDFLKFIFLIK